MCGGVGVGAPASFLLLSLMCDFHKALPLFTCVFVFCFFGLSHYLPLSDDGEASPRARNEEAAKAHALVSWHGGYRRALEAMLLFKCNLIWQLTD